MQVRKNKDDLRAILAAVFYLSTEADKTGFVEVSDILRHALARIDSHIKSEVASEQEYFETVLSPDLYHVLELIEETSSMHTLNLGTLKSILEKLKLAS
jgi:hypothetical protein